MSFLKRQVNYSTVNPTSMHWSDLFMEELSGSALSIKPVDWQGKDKTNLTNSTFSTQFANAMKLVPAKLSS